MADYVITLMVSKWKDSNSHVLKKVKLSGITYLSQLNCENIEKEFNKTFHDFLFPDWKRGYTIERFSDDVSMEITDDDYYYWLNHRNKSIPYNESEKEFIRRKLLENNKEIQTIKNKGFILANILTISGF